MTLLAGKIFLSEQRGVIETGLHKRLCTFNFGSYFNEHKDAPGSLCWFNDETLAPGHETELEIHEHTYLIIVPVTGDLFYSDCDDLSSIIGIGNIFFGTILPGTKVRMGNPYDDGEINFIVAGIRSESPFANKLSWLQSVDLITDRDKLIHTNPQHGEGSSELPVRVSIGQFGGRNEVCYQMTDPSNVLFTFVLAGAFETEGRLLHPRDGLALWNISKIDIEALSDNATLFTLEVRHQHVGQPQA